VDATGHARITDFGLSSMVDQGLDSMRSIVDDLGRATRWAAPEVLIGEEEPSKQADVFSFAMVTIEARY